MNGYMALDTRLRTGEVICDGMNGYMALDTRLRTREAME